MASSTTLSLKDEPKIRVARDMCGDFLNLDIRERKVKQVWRSFQWLLGAGAGELRTDSQIASPARPNPESGSRLRPRGQGTHGCAIRWQLHLYFSLVSGARRPPWRVFSDQGIYMIQGEALDGP